MMTVFAAGGGRVHMEDIHYGLLSPDGKCYERIEVTESVSSQTVKLGHPLRAAPAANQPVMRIIFGQVREDGSYLLRVRDDSASAQYLVRCILDGEERFQRVDFRENDGKDLLDPGEMCGKEEEKEE